MKLPSGQIIMAKYSGNCKLSDDLVLLDVLYEPEFWVSLVSVSKIVEDSGYSVLFNK